MVYPTLLIVLLLPPFYLQHPVEQLLEVVLRHHQQVPVQHHIPNLHDVTYKFPSSSITIIQRNSGTSASTCSSASSLPSSEFCISVVLARDVCAWSLKEMFFLQSDFLVGEYQIS